MNTINTITPIFLVIFLGLGAKKKGLIPGSFLKPANQLTYYLAIPAMIFRAIVKSDFRTQFDGYLLIGTLLPLLVVFCLSWVVLIAFRVSKNQRGTLVESSIHGNLGYIGLAVVFYYLGAQALPSTGILLVFLMVTHNSMAVIALQVNSTDHYKKRGLIQIFTGILANPIIVTAIMAAFFSLARFQMPIILDRTLGIIGNLALPLALLLIGASLSFHIKVKRLIVVLSVSLVKLLLLPAMGIWFYFQFDIPKTSYLPGLILLSTPVATITYVMATEMDGDPGLAVTIISVSTALSSVTMLFWLSIAEHIQ